MDSVDRDVMTTVNPVSTHHHWSVLDCDAEVYAVDFNGTAAYFIDVSFEDGKTDQGNRVEGLVDMYLCAMRLGVKVPTAVIGDDWWALKKFEGTTIRSMDKQTVVESTGEISQQQYEWDCAKLIILGYIDCTSHNFLLKSNGDYRHIDLQSANHVVRKRYPQVVCSLGQKAREMNLPPDVILNTERKAVQLAEYLSQNAILDEYVSEQVSENMEFVQKKLPLTGEKRGDGIGTPDTCSPVWTEVIPSWQEVEPVFDRIRP